MAKKLSKAAAEALRRDRLESDRCDDGLGHRTPDRGQPRRRPEGLRGALAASGACLQLLSVALRFRQARLRQPRFGPQLAAIGMRLTWLCASGRFGTVTVKTPFLNAAPALSGSTSSPTSSD